MNCYCLARNHNVYMCYEFLIQMYVIERCFSFMIFLDDLFLFIRNIELSVP